jgi:DNA repair exonuclease SbcCD ATPase subunit
MIFTAGNLITLGIVLITLVLFRQLDKNNRSLDKVRKYGERLKEDLAAFVAEREAAVKDYAIELDVQQKAAKELLKRLVITEEDLAAKAQAVTRIDERISAYDASLAELMNMTARVQENLNRIKEESPFTESVLKRVMEAKTQLQTLEKNLADIEVSFERQNAQALERAEEEVLAAIRSTVSDLQNTAETIERRVEDHRDAIVAIEKQRKETLQRDLAQVDAVLKDALEQARTEADRLEDAAFVKLKEQALERARKFQSTVEERLLQFQEATKNKLLEIQDTTKNKILEVQGLVKAFKDEWKQDAADLEAKQKAYKEEWKKDVSELNNLAKAQQEAWKQDISELNGLAKAQKEEWKKNLAEALAEVDGRLKEYAAAQAVQFQRLESAADEVSRLEAELRSYMNETEQRVRQDFALFEKESESRRAGVLASFESAVTQLKTEMANLETELNALKTRAYENVSEKLKLFEDDFFADLSKRSDEIDRRLAEWKAAMDSQLSQLEESGRNERAQLEQTYTELFKTRLAEQSERFSSDLERLKIQTGAFEEGIREQMEQADQSLQAFKEQLAKDLEEARNAAAAATKAEIGRHSLAMAELLKKDQRELETALKTLTDQVENKGQELAELVEAQRKNLDSWQARFTQQLRDAESAVEEARKRARELAAESDERLAAARSAIQEAHQDAETFRNELFSRTEEQAKNLDGAIKEADRRIKEFVAQTKLFEKADELKLALERKIEDLHADLDKLDQRRSEAAELEAQFIKIKRLEDEVNAKMTRFLSERHRIEVMEADFNRLIQTAQSVDEKLVQVTASDDTLQALQAQLRRLEDAVKDAEEKYQRLEKKNQILDATNDGIDRNFQSLRDMETALKQSYDEIKKLQSAMDSVKPAIDSLSKDRDRALEAAEKIADVDKFMAELEARIEQMQKAREWLARTETRLEELSKQAQEQVKLMGTLLKEEGKKGLSKDKGAPPIGVRETVVKLAHQGWTVDEIARTVKLSRGEVELILEISPKG